MATNPLQEDRVVTINPAAIRATHPPPEVIRHQQEATRRPPGAMDSNLPNLNMVAMGNNRNRAMDNPRPNMAAGIPNPLRPLKRPIPG